ncbi:MAG: response regulator [Elusimicrobiota bacterium]
MTVLVIDDDTSLLLMLSLYLKRAGLQAAIASDSHQALQLLAKRRFEWMIIDGEIFPLNGFELAAKARQHDPNIRIAMLSGIYKDSDILGHPIEKLFQKPLDMNALIGYLQMPPLPAFTS